MGRDVRLGKLIRDQRRRAGLTLTQLSYRSGLSKSHVGRIERGECFPSANSLSQIAVALGLNQVEVSSLLTRLLVDELVAAQRHALSILEAVSTLSKLNSTAVESPSSRKIPSQIAKSPRRRSIPRPSIPSPLAAQSS